VSKLKVMGGLKPRVPTKFPSNATFPPPRFLKVQDDDEGNNRNCWKFFEYWKEIAGTKDNPTDRADLLEIRWYLHWPVVDMSLADPKPKNTVFQFMQGPLWFDEPKDYVEECLKRFGSASWHVCLNEANVHSSLMQAYFPASDLNRYPPVKIDLKTLVVGHPANQTYIRRLRVEGVTLPWEEEAREEEEDEMAGDALKVMADQMSKITEKVLDSKDRETDARIELMQQEAELARNEEPPPPRPDSIDASVVNMGMELLANAANKSVDMVAKHAGSQLNTVEVMKTAAELFRQPVTDNGVGKVLESMMEMQKQNLEFMRSVVGMKKTAEGTWVAEAQQPQGGFEAEITRFQRMADILGFRKPGMEMQRREEPERPYREPEKSIWAAIAENPVPVVTMVTTGITLIANLVYNWRAEPGKAVSPQEALQKVQQQPPPQQPQQQQRANPKDPASWLGFAQQILPSFKAHFHGQDSGLSGFTFAEFILRNGVDGGSPTPEGRRSYNSIVENLGPKGFDQVIKNHPPLLEVVKDTPQQYAQFLTDFFGYDQMMEKQQQAEGAQVA
jgi:hypothetical protein